MGFFAKIRAGLAKTRQAIGNSLDGVFSAFTGANEEFFEELEETLILADVGVDTSMNAVERLRGVIRERKLKGGEEIREALREILSDMLRPEGAPGLVLESTPSVILIVGVNGVGKTTTIGKMAASLRSQGKKVLLAAGDTFRAAAADQLEIWAKRAGVDIVRQNEGADPAAVIFDAISAAKARGVDVIICDTAGRLHNKVNLMNELSKINRVIDRELPDASRETLLILDATTGQNGLIQAEQFRDAVGLTGVVITKLDGTARGGIAVAIADSLQIPIKMIGVGEGMDDLMEFDPDAFSAALLGSGKEE